MSCVKEKQSWVDNDCQTDGGRLQVHMIFRRWYASVIQAKVRVRKICHHQCKPLQMRKITFSTNWLTIFMINTAILSEYMLYFTVNNHCPYKWPVAQSFTIGLVNHQSVIDVTFVFVIIVSQLPTTRVHKYYHN